MTAIDPQRCPLCGHPNDCGMAAGKGICWCFSRPVPDEVIERIPPEARELACVCSTCAYGHQGVDLRQSGPERK